MMPGGGPAHVDRAREAVAAWRQRNPQGSAARMLADLSGEFGPSWELALRAVLVAADRHRARVITQITGQPGGPR